jgi:AraC-like DNA-binding protein
MRHRLLHRDDLVTIHDVACRAARSGPGAEECAERLTLVFPRRGVFVTHRAGREITADVGRAVVLWPDRPYRVSHPASTGDDCVAFAFEPDALREVPADAAAHDAGAVECEPALLHTAQRLRQALALRSIDSPAVQEAALAMLHAVMRRLRCAPRASAATSATRTAQRRIVETTRQAIAAHSHERLSLADLARHAGVSRFHLARTFRRLTGTSVHAHLNRARLGAALERVVAGDGDLTEVALACGFASHSHLTHAFRRTFGVPPSMLRRPPAAREIRRMSTILQARSALAM